MPQLEGEVRQPARIMSVDNMPDCQISLCFRVWWRLSNA